MHILNDLIDSLVTHLKISVKSNADKVLKYQWLQNQVIWPGPFRKTRLVKNDYHHDEEASISTYADAVNTEPNEA